FSTLAATGGHGVLPSALLPSSTDCGTAPFWATQHDQRGVLRHSGWARRRLRNPHHRALSPGARRWRATSPGDRHSCRKTWTRGFFRCAHDGSRIPCTGLERRDDFFAAGCSHRDRHLRSRPAYVLHLVFVCSRAARCCWPRLALSGSPEICALGCAQACADADFFGCDFVAANRDWFFPGAPAPFRGQHTFVTTKEHP